MGSNQQSNGDRRPGWTKRNRKRIADYLRKHQDQSGCEAHRGLNEAGVITSRPTVTSVMKQLEETGEINPLLRKRSAGIQPDTSPEMNAANTYVALLTIAAKNWPNLTAHERRRIVQSSDWIKEEIAKFRTDVGLKG